MRVYEGLKNIKGGKITVKSGKITVKSGKITVKGGKITVKGGKKMFLFFHYKCYIVFEVIL